MSPIPSPQLRIDINAEHSCNWRCCFGCREDVKVIPSPVNSPDSVTETETTEKVTHVVERHFHNQKGHKKAHL